MREILFRGQRLDTREWVFGYLAKDCFGGACDILFADRDGYKRVDEETVGQWTGLRDKDGAKIFEGDVLQFGAPKVKVAWLESKTRFAVVGESGYCDSLFEFSEFASLAGAKPKVIGNIHDNPELLERDERGIEA
jgi:uncharacterized phage protein (TIGR01671 family)